MVFALHIGQAFGQPGPGGGPGGGGDPGGGQPVPISGIELLIGLGALLGARKLQRSSGRKP